MACKPKRSAFKLIFYYFIIYFWCCKYGVFCLTQLINNNNNHHHHNININNNKNNSYNNSFINNNTSFTSEPKFGDRILPRNKQQIDDKVNIINNSYNINNSNNNNNNNNNNKNNNNTENNISAKNLKIIQPQVTLSSSSSSTTTSLSLKSEKPSSNDELLSTVTTQNFKTVVIQNKSTTKRNKILTNRKLEKDIIEDNNNNIVDGRDVGDNSSSSVSSAQAHRLEMSTEYFVVPSSVASMTRSTTIRPGGMILAAKTTETPKLRNITYPTNMGINNTGLRKEPWVIPVLVLASLSMLMMAAFELFVLFKAWRTSPSRRHLFLGQMLLLGLFSCAGLGAILTVTPTILSCATIRFGVGVAFALVFASLLVKCVFLISLNGGVYLPAQYQALLLFFAVLIQISVGAQWFFFSPPGVENVSVALSGSDHSITSSKYSLVFTANDVTILNPSILLCRTPYSELLLSLVYVVFLIFFVAILAIKSRRIRDNYREATYIGLSIGGIIPIWLGWTLCGLVIAERHRDACLAFGLVATSATVFLVMFMPKGRQLAAMGKHGVYVEDHEEHFSSLSRTGSGYSPSFFHFKPIKYGVMGTAGTTNTNTNNNNNINSNNSSNNPHHHHHGNDSTNKNQSVALGGDHLTLYAVPPPPPSYYTRMYHYFPAQCYFTAPQQQQQSQWYPGLFIRPDDTNVYTTLEPTMSSNPNVYFQRGLHPGMMY